MEEKNYEGKRQTETMGSRKGRAGTLLPWMMVRRWRPFGPSSTEWPMTKMTIKS